MKTDQENEEATSKLTTTEMTPSSATSLEHTWSLWYDLQPKKGLLVEDYRKLLQKVGDFNSISSFWSTWHNLFQNLPDQVCNFQVFKEGIEPIWEHERNINGGKWVITRATDSSVENNIKDWLSLVLSMIAGGLGSEEDICGAVLSIRNWGISITVWNRDSTNMEQIREVSDKLRILLNLDRIYYQPHQASLKRNVVQRHASWQSTRPSNNRNQNQNQKNKNAQPQPQSKKSLQRVVSAPAVLPATPKGRQKNSQNLPATKQGDPENKTQPKKRRNRGRNQKSPAPPTPPRQTEGEQKTSAPLPLLPPANQNSKPKKQKKQKPKPQTQPKSQEPKEKKKATSLKPKLDSAGDESLFRQDFVAPLEVAGVVSQKFANFVRPLTSVDKTLGISLLIGATLTAIYIL